MWEHASFGDKVSFAFGSFFIIAMVLLGIGNLTGNVDGPAPAPVEQTIDYDQLYRNCMDSIEGYRDDGGSRWDDAADACAMIGSSEGYMYPGCLILCSQGYKHSQQIFFLTFEKKLTGVNHH